MHRSTLKAWISHVIIVQLLFSSQQPKWHLFWHPKNPQARNARILVWDQRMIYGKGAIGLENQVPDPDVWRKDYYRALQICSAAMQEIVSAGESFPLHVSDPSGNRKETGSACFIHNEALELVKLTQWWMVKYPIVYFPMISQMCLLRNPTP